MERIFRPAWGVFLSRNSCHQGTLEITNFHDLADVELGQA